MGLARNVRNTVKEFRKNPKQVSFRLLGSMIVQLYNFGVSKKEISEFCKSELNKLE